jgi:hypothetical protein
MSLFIKKLVILGEKKNLNSLVYWLNSCLTGSRNSSLQRFFWQIYYVNVLCLFSPTFCQPTSSRQALSKEASLIFNITEIEFNGVEEESDVDDAGNIQRSGVPQKAEITKNPRFLNLKMNSKRHFPFPSPLIDFVRIELIENLQKRLEMTLQKDLTCPQLILLEESMRY